MLIGIDPLIEGIYYSTRVERKRNPSPLTSASLAFAISPNYFGDA